MIQITDTHSFGQANAAKLGPNHGYRIDGDIALLHADVAVADKLSAPRSQWALQLWACESPFSGGTLQGVKIAEAALPLADAGDTQRLDAEALAKLPGGQRDYSMVLVLASGSNGAFDQIHDFANYPARERFITPHLEGVVAYQVDGADVVLRAESIRNPRRADNLSGSLALELWAVMDIYQGGAVDAGLLLASADVGRIAGETAFVALERRVKFNPPAAGRWNVVLMLREWVPGGYVTRDFCTFAQRYVVAEPTKAIEPKAEANKYALHAINGSNGVNGSNGGASSSPFAKAAESAEAVAERPAAVAQPEATVELRAVAQPAVVERPLAAAQPATAVERTLAVAQPAAASIERTAAATQLAAAVTERSVAAKPTASAAPTASSIATNSAATAPSTSDGRVSIMTASVEEIAQLKGLTRKIALEIVKGRPYASIDELTRVRGVGPKLLAKLRAAITL